MIGLEDWRTEAYFTALHLRYLENRYWRTKYSVAFPRLRPYVGEDGFNPEHPASERNLFQLICAYRLLSEDVELSISTRESADFRDRVMPFGVTVISAGSKTTPGGYAHPNRELEQWSINDNPHPARSGSGRPGQRARPGVEGLVVLYAGGGRNARPADPQRIKKRCGPGRPLNIHVTDVKTDPTMRILIQRVREASVDIGGERHSAIGAGMLVLTGIEEADTDTDVEWLCGKLLKLRIFDDEAGVMNRSAEETGADILIVSQFTLHALTRKGNRPSYIRAARPEKAVPLYESFVAAVRQGATGRVETGVFGADMQVALVNDGPVTIWIDSQNRE